MIEKRPSNDRGSTNIDWLDSRHSFSFGQYHDASRQSHGALRVINDDRVAALQGFGTHPHRNAEIVSYVLSGALEHRDSMGNGNVIKPGQFQYMSAGRGVTHSEFNPNDETSHFLQIWLLPNEENAEPAYAQSDIAQIEPKNGLQLIASNIDPAAPIQWRTDATLWRGSYTIGDSGELPGNGDRGYLHVIKGKLQLGEISLSEGDAAAISNESSSLNLVGLEDSEFLWFSL
ncbi:pirin family protein [Cerasicoccus arenae]|uniref:Pirin family protein n=1 Tax=Cerasicoccus arenae TaxID=424488 RepID=A0A8J3GFP3_9BACT|nr:pirin-like bicupin family protein [Cerasicoccus arenae]MBK1859091.1 pirin family protein [Cerasicoccus arenae]GHC07599.1 hypothetical protein GCM10007047_25910 [Cerasicoccus arenae]